MAWNDVEQSEKNTEGKVPYTKLEEGNTLIRILDGEPYSFWNHWCNTQKTGVTCLGKDCPICNIIAAARANKETPQYNNSKRHAIRIWNYNTNQMEVLIQGKAFFSQLLTLLKEVGDLREYDLKVIRKGKDKDTAYTILPQAPSEFAKADECEELNIPELLTPPTKDEMLQIIQGKTWDEINKAKEDAA